MRGFLTRSLNRRTKLQQFLVESGDTLLQVPANALPSSSALKLISDRLTDSCALLSTHLLTGRHVFQKRLVSQKAGFDPPVEMNTENQQLQPVVNRCAGAELSCVIELTHQQAGS